VENRYSIEELRRRLRQNWPETATPETELMIGLLRLNDIVTNCTDRICADYNLTPAGFETLVTLRSLEPPRQLTPNELLRSILVTSGGMTKVVHHLEQQGWVERVAHASDRRSRLVRLTAAGEAHIEACMAAVMQGDRDLLSPSLDDGEVAHLRDLLLRAVAKLEEG